MIDRELFLRFCDDALDQMVATVTVLGDDRVNVRLPVDGANSAYGLVTHCAGVMGAWARQVNRGITVARDRDAEFEMTGTVAELVAALEVARTRLHDDVTAADLGARPARPDDEHREDRWYQTTQGGVLMHVYEELSQHCGHLDLIRDLLQVSEPPTPVHPDASGTDAGGGAVPSRSSPSDVDRGWLGRCVELAADAVASGDQPFGSVLVDGAGVLRAEAVNREVTAGDATAHPELELAQWAGSHLSVGERAAATVYTSGEHCPMCAAAHAWVGLGRIVFVMSSAQHTALLAELGENELAAVAPLPASVVAPSVRVEGPEPSLVGAVADLHRAARARR